MTDAERLLWRHLRAHRLDGQKFRRQQPIGPYVVDFVHFGARLIVEADGGQHNGSERDHARDAWLQKQGFRVMRFWNNEILQNTEAVLGMIDAVVARPPSPPAPLPQGERGEAQGPSCARGEAQGPSCARGEPQSPSPP
ncbi:MAG: endonuclease domain-containing protein [Pseudomonadota bacterium]